MPSKLKFDKLTNVNYHKWKIYMEALLTHKQLLGVVDGTTRHPGGNEGSQKVRTFYKTSWGIFRNHSPCFTFPTCPLPWSWSYEHMEHLINHSCFLWPFYHHCTLLLLPLPSSQLLWNHVHLHCTCVPSCISSQWGKCADFWWQFNFGHHIWTSPFLWLFPCFSWCNARQWIYSRQCHCSPSKWIPAPAYVPTSPIFQ